MAEGGWEPGPRLLVGCSLTPCVRTLPSGVHLAACNTACRMRFQAARLWAGSAPGHMVQPTGNTQAGHCCPHDPTRLPVGSSSIPFGGSLTRRCQHVPASPPWAKQEEPESVSVGLRPARCQTYRHRLSRSTRVGVGGLASQPSAEVAKSTFNCAVEFLSQCQTVPGGFI